MKPCSERRWRLAQLYELSWWNRISSRSGYVDSVKWPWYKAKAARLKALLESHGRSDVLRAGSLTVEVGSGPIGIAPMVTSGLALLVDPLARSYRELPTFRQYRGGWAMTATGEALPLKSSVASLVILENTLDHVRAPFELLREIRRVLVSGGLLYLTVNCRTGVGRLVHAALAASRVDVGHPHSLTKAGLMRFTAAAGFKTVWSEVEPFWTAWRRDLFDSGLSGTAKAILGVSEVLACTLQQANGSAIEGGPASTVEG